MIINEYKKVCDKFKVSPKALRIYEDLGIIVPKRQENNYRNYSEDDILKIRQLIVLKEMGIPLKKIKILLNEDSDGENKIVRALWVQLKAVENRINELKNIKVTLDDSINDVLNRNEISDYSEYFSKIDKCLSKNIKKRNEWLDKWNFDSWAKDYDTSVKDDSTGDLKLFEKYDLVLESAAKMIYQSHAVNVLDIGCGTGNLYGKLNGNLNFVGMDQSIEMLLQAKHKYPNIKVRLGNFLDKPFEENKFDVVVSTYAFHHLTPYEKQKAVSIMMRYLKPGGKIVIADLMFLSEVEKAEEKRCYLKVIKKIYGI